MVENIYLAHHGVKGMKWGVRRYQNPDGSLTSAGEKRYYKKSKDNDNFDVYNINRKGDRYNKKKRTSSSKVFGRCKKATRER